ncbi:MAG: hypothetical protein CO093_03725 [Alphaproteobacteria bacterium CG_4_9_14_3_um_filter_47_13]|nr:MAG: hypothetical protein CO093_03725 [Alphaproteobacteria bacterium CG_4_9_14_3_um_filter_47_13]
MTQDVLSLDHLRQLDKLKEIVGGLDECKRLGFVHIDGQGVQSLSPVGLGFLLFIVAGEVKTPPEAFAAGWQAGTEQETA